MEELKFTDAESNETFEGFGRLLAEARIYGINNPKAMARLYQIENRLRTTDIPDYILVADFGDNDLMVVEHNDPFSLASWTRSVIKDDLESEDGNILRQPMAKLLRDADANDLDLHKVHMNVIEYQQILQGKRAFNLCCDYQNPVIREFAVNIMMVLERLRELLGEETLTERFMAENDISVGRLMTHGGKKFIYDPVEHTSYPVKETKPRWAKKNTCNHKPLSVMMDSEKHPAITVYKKPHIMNSGAILKPGKKKKPLSVAEKRPKRWYDCNQYLECLTAAALASKLKVPCEGCEAYQSVDMFAISEGDMPGIIRLFQAVFGIKESDPV